MFNRRRSRTLAEKPTTEQIPIAVPAAIALSAFETTPRRATRRPGTGLILVTGSTTCNGPMTLRTGTSRLRQVHCC